MAKVLVRSSPGREPVPFLRGILIRSLQDAGMRFEESYALSNLIRNRLSKGKDDLEVSEREIRKMVEESLAVGYDPEILTHYRNIMPVRNVILVKRDDGQIIPFSRTTHQKRLEPCGLDPENAAEVTAEVYAKLLAQRRQTYTLDQIREITQEQLEKRIGLQVSERYRAWSRFIHSGRPLLVLLGGAPGCGKSTVAAALASHLDIVRTQSSDMLREVMRMMIPKKLLPALHTSSFTAWKKLPLEHHQEPRNVALINGYLTQAELLSVALEGAIQRTLQERVSMILEGVHIHPDLLRKISNPGDAIIVTVMLGVLNADELRARFKGRGKGAPDRRSRRYLEEFDAIWDLQSFLLSEADRSGVPIIRNDDREEAVRQSMQVIIEQIVKDLTHEQKKSTK